MTTEKEWNSFRIELLGFIKRRIHDQTLAEDVLQKVFIKIHANLNSYIYLSNNTLI